MHFRSVLVSAASRRACDVDTDAKLSHVAQLCYSVIYLEQGKIRPSVTLYSLYRSLPNLVWLIVSVTPTSNFSEI